MAFSFGYSPWLLGLSLLLAGGLTYWSYRYTIPALAPHWRWALGSLRFVSLALICFLLLEPILRTVDETEKPPVLAVLVDNSQSMRVVQGAADTSAEAVRSQLGSVLSPLQERPAGTTPFFGFDDVLQALPDRTLDSLTFTGRRTNLGTALQSVREELKGENLRAVALVSDGQYNSGRDPARIADRFSVPVHTITVGDTTRQRDLQVRRVVTNDIAYVDTKVPVRVTLQATDLGDAETTVSLLRNGRVLDEKTVSLPSGTAERVVDLTVQPTEAGLHQYTVRASPVANESITENNVRSVRLRVLDSKRQALLLGASPSPDVAALRRVLTRDANTTVTTRIPKKDGTFYGGPLPDSLDQFDVVVYAGFPSTVVPDRVVEQVATALEDQPALFFLAPQTDLTAWRTHFAEALPASPPSSPVRFAEASISPVESARSHPLFRIEGVDLRLFSQLPPLKIPGTAWAPTPDAQILATGRRPALTEGDPVIVVRRRAGRRTALFLGTGTWRWATLPTDLNAADPLWPGLVSNLLRWSTTNVDDRQVRVQPTAASFEGDESVTFTGQVYDESRTPVSKARVSVEITDSTGATSPHTMDPLGNGRYTLDVGTLPEGTYRYEASARRDNTPIGTDRGTFSVGALQLEYQAPRANPTLMRRIAVRSGGRAYTAESAAALPADLDQDSSFASTVSTTSTEAKLWRTSIFLALILGLLAAEWTLRKRFGLS